MPPDPAVPDLRPLEQTVFDARPLLRDCLDKLLAERGLAPSLRLEDFRARAESALPLEARLTLVRQALVLMRDFYANRPLKEALQAAQPVRRLELLQFELERLERRQHRSDLPPELEFHREMNEIFTSVHDRHARYLLPEAFADRWALLGFDVEVFYDPLTGEGATSRLVGEIRLNREPQDGSREPPDGGRVIEEIRLRNVAGRARQPRYMATHLIAGFADAIPDAVEFQPGVEIVSWNGIPIERAVELNGDRHAGANRAARHARGVTRLTTRPLRLSALPDEEEWVMIGYRPSPSSDEVRHLVLEWRVASLARTLRRHDVVGTIHLEALLPEDRVIEEIRLDTGDLVGGLDESTDEEAAAVGILRQGLWQGASSGDGQQPEEALVRGVDESRMPAVLRAVPMELTGSDDEGDSKIGYMRLYTFAVDPDELVEEFVRLLRVFRDVHQAQYLILDVRDNGGGRIPAGERLLQTLTPRRIEPERFEFLSNPATFELCRRNAFLKPWREALERSLDLGAQYSGSFHLSSEELCNDVGQVFFGPVVLIVNALSYSTSDVFAAGFQDHGIGPILATDDNVGAGGANTASHADLVSLWGEGETLRPLPHGAAMKVAIRRALRVGERVGTPLEELGIEPDERHDMTRQDLLSGNVDLIRRAVDVLKSQPLLDVETWDREVKEWQRMDAGIRIKPKQKDISHMTVRFQQPADNLVTFSGLKPDEWVVAEPPSVLHVTGFDGDRLVANHAVNLRPRLELNVDWFVDFYFFLRVQADLEEGQPPDLRPGFEDAVTAVADAVAAAELGWYILDGLVIGAGHTDSLHDRLTRAEVPVGTADGLCAPLREVELLFLETVWPQRRLRIEAMRGRLEKDILPKERQAVADLVRSLDLAARGIHLPAYLVTELPFGWGSRSFTTKARLVAPFVASIAGSLRGLVYSLFLALLGVLRSEGAIENSAVYRLLRDQLPPTMHSRAYHLLERAQVQVTRKRVFGLGHFSHDYRKALDEGNVAEACRRIVAKVIAS